jgi:hypothetical protein
MVHLKPTEFLVYYELLYHTYGYHPGVNTCFISNKAIMRATGTKSKQTIIDAIKRLTSMGLISREIAPNGSGEASTFTVFLPVQAKNTLGFELQPDSHGNHTELEFYA